MHEKDNAKTSFTKKLQKEKSNSSSFNPETWYDAIASVISGGDVKVMETITHCTISSEVFEKVKGMDNWAPDVAKALDQASNGCRGFHQLNQRDPKEFKEFLKGKAADAAAKKTFGIG